MRTVSAAASTLHYILTDHLGSTSAILDETGTLINQQRYLPFGQPRADVPTPFAAPTDFGFTGQRDLTGTGLMDYKARFYSPHLSRFIQPDTLIPGAGDPQAWNRYSYVLNSPVSYNDPSGHFPCSSFQSCVDFLSGVVSFANTIAEKTVKYFQKNPVKVNIDLSLKMDIWVALPNGGGGLMPVRYKTSFDMKPITRLGGRTVGDDKLGPVAFAVGYIATVVPSQLENLDRSMKGDVPPWNDWVGDAVVDSLGFGTSETAGNVSGAITLAMSGSNPPAGLLGEFTGDILWGLGWDAAMDGPINGRGWAIDRIGEIPDTARDVASFLASTPARPFGRVAWRHRRVIE